MVSRSLILILLLLLPGAVALFLGHPEVAQYLALGTVLAFNLGSLARPVAVTGLLIPVLYAAASMSAQLSDGVVALIVAVAAAVGAASSRGNHRGLLSLLAAVLIGSFEPALGETVLVRAGAMLAGALHGLSAARWLARSVEVPTHAVHPQTALGYGVLLALLAMLSWFAARLTPVPYGWWLPLAICAIGEPALAGSVRRAVLTAAVCFAATLPLLAVIDGIDAPTARVILLIGFALLVFVMADRHRWMPAFMLTPIVALFVRHPGGVDPLIESLHLVLPSCAVAFGCALLGKWLLWSLRPDTGRVVA
jgi:hypothetical protein